MALHRRLHDEMLLGREIGGGHEAWRQGRFAAMHRAIEARGIILDPLAALAAVGHQHFALIGNREDRLDAARHIAGEKRNRAGRRYRGQKRIAHAVLGDLAAQVFRQMLGMARGQIAIALIERKGPLLASKCRTGAIGSVIDQRHPMPCGRRCFLAAIGKPTHGESIGKPGQTKAKPALGARFMRLRGQGIVRDIDDIVHEAHGARHDVCDRRFVDAALCP